MNLWFQIIRILVENRNEQKWNKGRFFKKVISKIFWPGKTLNKLIMWLSIDDVSLTFQRLMETWHDFWSMNLQLLDANWQISNDIFAENTGSILRLRSWYFFSISAYCVKVALPESELCQHMQTIVIALWSSYCAENFHIVKCLFPISIQSIPSILYTIVVSI